MCEAIRPFHARGEKRASFAREQNVICSQTLQLDDIAHEQTIICRQLFVCHVMGCWPMKRKKKVVLNDHDLYLIWYLLHNSKGASCIIKDSKLWLSAQNWTGSTFLRKTFRAFGVPLSVVLFFLITNKNETLHRWHFSTIFQFAWILPYSLLKSSFDMF